MALENGVGKTDGRIQLVHLQKDIWSIIKDITQGGHQEEAFYVCNLSEVIKQYKTWKITMPRVESHYAVKCNDTKLVLEVLAALGTGFDCSSKEEMRKVLDLGVNPNRIIFAHPTKMASHIKYAAEMGVSKMTFDNENELYKIKRYYQDARMVIRIRYDDLSAVYTLGNKFGCDYKTEAVDLLRVARDLDINVIGVSFHIGSNSNDFSIYAKAIAAARYVFDAAVTIGYNFNFLDIGGGFPGRKYEDFIRIGKSINDAIEMHFSDPNIRVIAEPGRFYVSSAFTLVSNIHSMKDYTETDKRTGEKVEFKMYYVDVSIYGALVSVLCDEVYPPTPPSSRINIENYPSIVWGATCDGLDKISHNFMLPKLKIGDQIIFKDVGAYTLAIACEFSGFPTPKTHFTIDKNDWELLKQLKTFPKDRIMVENKTYLPDCTP